MADRYFVWHINRMEGSGTNQGPAYVLDRDYALPGKVRLYARNAPGYSSLRVDIKADGVSLFEAAVGNYPSSVPSIQKGRNIEEEWDSFKDSLRRIDRYAVLTCDVLDSGGAGDITVTLELDAAESEGAYQRSS